MKLCLIGMGPFPTEPGAIIIAPSIRARMFAEPLLKAKYELKVILLEESPRRDVQIEGASEAIAVTPETILDPALLASQIDLSFTRAIFGVGSLMPATAAARLATHLDVPCWIDIFGDPLAELHAAQLRQGGTPDSVARDHIWKLFREALLRGDAFSAVSGPQRHALMGQLGLLGRYGNDWNICRHIAEMPVGIPSSWLTDESRPAFPKLLREYGLNEKSRYVFFGGSWNVWLDEDTMGKAIATALEQDPELHFVACGIPTGPAGEQVRHGIMEALKPFAKRVVELPPQHLSEENGLLAWSSATVKLDRAIPESELGTRSRLLPMIRWGAHPVTTMEAELETVLVAQGLASGVERGDWQRAAREIIHVSQRTVPQRQEDEVRGRKWLQTVTFDRICEPVRQWLASGAPRWPSPGTDGMLDRWAAFPPDPGQLYPKSKKKNWIFG